MTEITVFSIISAMLLFGFIILGVLRFGLLDSYSAYSSRWEKAVPMNNMNLWSIVTFVAAFLLTPGLVELGALSAWQFLGFLTPLYLIIVSLTPKWATDERQRKIHTVFAALCALGAFTWLVLTVKNITAFIVMLVFILALGFLSGTMKSSLIFWLEMLMFLSVYAVVLLMFLI